MRERLPIEALPQLCATNNKFISPHCRYVLLLALIGLYCLSSFFMNKLTTPIDPNKRVVQSISSPLPDTLTGHTMIAQHAGTAFPDTWTLHDCYREFITLNFDTIPLLPSRCREAWGPTSATAPCSLCSHKHVPLCAGAPNRILLHPRS